MFKRLLYCCISICFIFLNASAQDSTRQMGCGSNAAFFTSLKLTSPGPGAIVVPSFFPAAAIDTCGKIAVYYEDRRLALLPGGIAAGFADATLGATRRGTICAVMSYLQSVFDFSGLPDGGIRLFIDTTFAPTGYHAPTGHALRGEVGEGGPFYAHSASHAPIGGFVHDYILDPLHDPNPSGYHGYMQYNFDSSVTYPHRLGHIMDEPRPLDINNGLDTPSACFIDLYSTALHLSSHCLGFASLRDPSLYHIDTTLVGHPVITDDITLLDTSLHAIADPHVTATPFAPGYILPIGALPSLETAIGRLWVNGQLPPHNFPVFWPSFAHLDIYNYEYSARLAQGDFQEYVMGFFSFPGKMRRTYSKGDLEVFHNIIGLPFNPTAFTSSGPGAQYYTNSTPYSDKMRSFAYSKIIDSANFAERVSADDTMTNNTGRSIVINLNALADLHDADGDSIFVLPGSIAGIRGCGNGGNNHAQLSINANNTIITYTPRANFYGRAQFGVNITDKKETGAYVLFTFDVFKGNRVTVTTGDELVLNGNFEEGSEVKTDSAIDVNNSTNLTDYTQPGRVRRGFHFSDAHPYDCYTSKDWGAMIRHSYVECGFVPYTFGYPLNSFPHTGINILRLASPNSFPESKPKDTAGNRYLPLGHPGALFNLGDSMRQCHTYVLKFDVRHTYKDSAGYAYASTPGVTLGFTQSKFLFDPVTVGSDDLGLTHFIQKSNKFKTTRLTDTAWTEVVIPFTYCSDTPSNVFYLNLSDAFFNDNLFPTYLIDNVSIKEQAIERPPLAITTTATSSCTKLLDAGERTSSCSGTYAWRVKGNPTILATGQTYEVDPQFTTRYIVTVTDACYTDSAEIMVDPCRCLPGFVFGGQPYTTLSGTLPSTSYSSGYYYIPSSITIASNTSFTGAKVLIAPGVTITVNNDVKLTLDSSHLFACPDTNMLWNGIVLASGSSSSARIEVRNNTLIEDAVTAISANAPKHGMDTIIVTSNVYF